MEKTPKVENVSGEDMQAISEGIADMAETDLHLPFAAICAAMAKSGMSSEQTITLLSYMREEVDKFHEDSHTYVIRMFESIFSM